MTAADLAQIFDGPNGELAPAKTLVAAAIASTGESPSGIVAALVGAIAIVAASHEHTVAIISAAIAGLDHAARIAGTPRPAPGLPS